MKPSTLPFEKQFLFRNERWLNRGFLLSSLLLTSLFCLLTLYSPNFSLKSTSSSHDLHQQQHQKGNGNDDEESCNLFEGQWIPDLNATSYSNYSCPTIPESKNCFKNGREDVDFLNWRWKPQGCELPKFDPQAFLETLRGKNLAFIGDSVARNQLDSLLCLLSKEEIPVNVFKDVDDRFRTWYFPRTNFTVMVLWTRFLVADEEETTKEGTNSGTFKLHLDRVDAGWANKIQDIDYAIISDGHWFFRKLYLYRGGVLSGCVYCSEPNVTDKGLVYAFRESFRTAFLFINQSRGCSNKGMTALLRTFSPAHFEQGTWNDGGSCNRTRPQHQLDEKSIEFYMELRGVQLEELERARRERSKKKKKNKTGSDHGEARFEALDVTRAMLMRPDGHPGSHWGNKWMKGYNDCVHWCLPGPVDLWNQLLMAMLQKRVEETQHSLLKH